MTPNLPPPPAPSTPLTMHRPLLWPGGPGHYLGISPPHAMGQSMGGFPSLARRRAPLLLLHPILSAPAPSSAPAPHEVSLPSSASSPSSRPSSSSCLCLPVPRSQALPSYPHSFPPDQSLSPISPPSIRSLLLPSQAVWSQGPPNLPSLWPPLANSSAHPGPFPFS